MKDKLTIQLITACIVTLSGLTLLFMAFWTSPPGEMHNSILIAFGEAMSFAGALFGVDYSYKYKINRRKPEDNNNNNNTKEK